VNDQHALAFYEPKPLSEQPPPAALALAMKADEGRLTFYVGAGLSMSPPTDLPSGDKVQELIADRARKLLGIEVPEPAGTQPTLEELGDAAAAVGHETLDRLRALAADAIDFTHVLPNFGHEAVALLLREGIVEVLSVNWDCGVESAARDLDFEVVRILRQQDRADRPMGPVMDKLNGCASQPPTLRITREEVDVPQAWAAHRVGSVLTDTTVVFVGLGTVGKYVSDGVEQMLEASKGRTVPIVVVSTSLSDDWKAALGDSADDAHAGQRAEAFLDDLLRATLLFALVRAVERAKRWAHDGHPAAQQLLDGADRVYEALTEHAAVPVWRWWRDGAGGQCIGTPFILNQLGETAFATICALVGNSAFSVSGHDDALVLELADRYVEICSWPGESAATVVTRQAARIRKRRRRNVYTDMTKRVVSIAVGHDGALPDSTSALDIADPGGSMQDIVEGSERVLVEWIPGEAFAQGVLGKAL
jgi:hypothetical protein